MIYAKFLGQKEYIMRESKNNKESKSFSTSRSPQSSLESVKIVLDL